MRVILAYVTSRDGFLVGPHGEQSREWASPEDQEYFQKLVLDTGLVVIGSHTYEEHKHLLRPAPGLRRVVMTHHPEKYASDEVPGILEFSSLSPAELVAQMEKEGHTQVLIAGSPGLYREFFRAGLISGVHATVEPVVLGGGILAESGIPPNAHLALIDTRPLNTHGTLLLKYKVIY